MLHAEHLTIAIGTRTLCRGLDLAVAPGELWAVLGCNGSGKTTLLHALAGLAPAQAGRVSVAGKTARGLFAPEPPPHTRRAAAARRTRSSGARSPIM